MRLKASLFATAIMLAAAIVPGSAMSTGGGFHGPSGMTASSLSLRGSGIGPSAHPGNNLSVNASFANRPAPVPLKRKAGKLNGACYRSCTRVSMGDPFRTDQFCAYSCSLD